jgi:hypothetical protein
MVAESSSQEPANKTNTLITMYCLQRFLILLNNNNIRLFMGTVVNNNYMKL